MSGDRTGPPPDDAVGYGRPPRHTRFRKGRSGNPKGRPRTRGAVDVAALLDAPVTVRRGGETRTMSPKEVTLRKLLKKALADRDLKAIAHLLEQFEKYGALAPPATTGDHVLVLPNGMPWRMALIMLGRFGPPPWNPRQRALGRAAYLAGRTEAEREADEAVGYPDP